MRQKNDLGIDFGLALPLVTHDRGGLEKCGDGRGMYGCLGGLRVPPWSQMIVVYVPVADEIG